MKTKRTSSFVITLLLILTAVQAQTTSESESPPWQTYTIEGEDFSVALPTLPAMHNGGTFLERIRKWRREWFLGSYADGVVYTVQVLENPKPRQSLEAFIEEQAGSSQTLPRGVAPGTGLSAAPVPAPEPTPVSLRIPIEARLAISQRDLTINGFPGKSLLFSDGMTQFFAAEDRLYVFRAFGAPLDDARMTRFFSSLSLTKKKGSINVADGPGLPFEPVAQSKTSIGDPKEHFTGRQVGKKVRLAMRPEPSYTESARQNSITGTVVLKCIFASDGSVKNIIVVSGLPDGLTEKAIDAARKIKFIPAIKDGKYVSMWMQLEYNFNLY